MRWLVTYSLTYLQVYYEVVLLVTGRFPQVGWAVASSDDEIEKFVPGRNMGVGDCMFSWAADGVRGALWHESKPTDYPATWKAGDVLGCAADLDRGQLWFGLNGEWGQAPDVTDCTWPNGVFPAFSGALALFELHLGSKTLRFGGPSARFEPLLRDRPLAHAHPHVLDAEPKPESFYAEEL